MLILILLLIILQTSHNELHGKGKLRVYQLEGNGVYDEETLAVINSFDTKFLHLWTSSCLEFVFG